MVRAASTLAVALILAIPALALPKTEVSSKPPTIPKCEVFPTPTGKEVFVKDGISRVDSHTFVSNDMAGNTRGMIASFDTKSGLLFTPGSVHSSSKKYRIDFNADTGSTTYVETSKNGPCWVEFSQEWKYIKNIQLFDESVPTTEGDSSAIKECPKVSSPVAQGTYYYDKPGYKVINSYSFSSDEMAQSRNGKVPAITGSLKKEGLILTPGGKLDNAFTLWVQYDSLTSADLTTHVQSLKEEPCLVAGSKAWSKIDKVIRAHLI